MFLITGLITPPEFKQIKFALFLFTSLMFSFYLQSTGVADTLLLKDKREFKGKILPRQGQEIFFRTKRGVLCLNPSEILSIHYDEEPWGPDPHAVRLYRQRSLQISPDDIQGRLDLAQFCLDEKLYDEAAREFRKLIPVLTDQTAELEKWIEVSERASFQTQLNKASWWVRVAHQPLKARSLIQDLQTVFPEFARKSELHVLLFQVQNELECEIFREKKKLDFISWNSTNFKVYGKDLSEVKSIANQCESMRLKICNILGIKQNHSWQEPCEVLLFDQRLDYLKASGAEPWSGGSNSIVFELDENSMPQIRERFIMAFRMSESETEKALAHEICHLVFQDLLGVTSSIPMWISEGFATFLFLGDQEKPASVTHPISLEILAQTKEYPAFERAFYEQSGKWVEFLIQKGGLEKFLSFSYLLATGDSLELALMEIYPDELNTIKQKIRDITPSGTEKKPNDPH